MPEPFPQSLLDAASNHLMGGDSEPEAPPPAQNTAQTEAKEATARSQPEKTPDISSLNQEETKSPDPKEGKDGKTETEAAERPKSKYKQGEERKFHTWQEINAKKENLEKELQALAKEKEEVARLRDEVQRRALETTAYRDRHGRTAAEYEEAAERFRKQGDNELAQQTLQLAEQVKREGEQAREQARQEAFAVKWRENYVKTAETHPELKDHSSSLYREVLDLINRRPLLATVEDGISYAVEAVLLNRRAKDLENTSTENKRLKSEMEALQKKLSIGASPPASRPESGDKPYAQLSKEERLKRLEQAAADADREAGL